MSELLFDPEQPRDPAGRGFRLGDREITPVYDYEPRIVLAVNVALATGRPLLVRGAPGTGKSSLAADIARRQSWRYYPATISSRTQAQDLLWRFDTVRRLADAQVKRLQQPAAYLQPGVLWWAFDRYLAARRGLAEGEPQSRKIPLAADPAADIDHPRAVVLLDEMEKADPDVPNNLLDPLGSFRFRVEETVVPALEVRASLPPLVIITSNEERELPRAFLRRCIALNLERPEGERLLRIARLHFPADQEALIQKVATLFEGLCEQQRQARQPLPSTAEFLDAIAACRELGVPDPGAGHERWEQIASVALRKPPPRDLEP